MTENHAIILFDGVCNLCNSSVQFIIKNDTYNHFKFASLQSEFAKPHLQVLQSQIGTIPDALVLVVNNRYYVASTAALKIAQKLRFPLPLFGVFFIVPAPLRDAIYNYVAKNRYQWFGKKESCMVPTAALRSKFLDT